MSADVAAAAVRAPMQSTLPALGPGGGVKNGPGEQPHMRAGYPHAQGQQQQQQQDVHAGAGAVFNPLAENPLLRALKPAAAPAAQAPQQPGGGRGLLPTAASMGSLGGAGMGSAGEAARCMRTMGKGWHVPLVG